MGITRIHAKVILIEEGCNCLVIHIIFKITRIQACQLIAGFLSHSAKFCYANQIIKTYPNLGNKVYHVSNSKLDYHVSND